MKTNKDSILKELEDSKGYEVALLTTFNFDIGFFERAIFPLLLRNGIRKINLLVDAGQLNEALKNESSRSLGKEYFVSPVLIQGSFHPKVILLLGEKKAKLIVTSANITMSAYFLNNEVFNVFNYDTNDYQYSSLFLSAVKMLQKLINISIFKDVEVLHYINQFDISHTQENTDICLIENTEFSILQQVQQQIGNENVKTINIAVPFFDDQLVALKHIKESFGCDCVNLYIQNERNTFPVDYNAMHKIVSLKEMHLYKKNKVNNNERFYHGKVIELITETHSYILYGSANCTVSALLKTYKEYGNVECCVLVKSKVDENQRFFNDFVIEKNQKLIKGDFGTPESNKNNFIFLYGAAEKDLIKLYVKYRKLYQELNVSYQTQSIEHIFVDDYILISLPFTQELREKSIFKLDFSFNKITESIDCWYIDFNELNAFRSVNSKTLNLEEYSVDSDISRYAVYMKKMIEVLYANDEWKEIEAQNRKAVLNIENSDDVDEDELNDDYLLEDDLPDVYVEKRTPFQIAYSRSLSFANRYYESLVKTKKTGDKQKTQKKKLEYPEIQKKPRKASSDEKHFARFVKRYINKYLLSPDADKLSYDYYKVLCGTAFDIITRFVYCERIEDFLTVNYVIETRMKLVSRMFDKLTKVQAAELDGTMIPIVLLMLAERGYNGFGSSDFDSKNILSKLNDSYNIRDDVHDWVKCLDLTKAGIIIDTDYNPVTFIDSLFGYKTYKQLIQYFRDMYGDQTEIMIINGVFRVDVLLINKKAPTLLANRYVEEITKYLSANKLKMKEIIIYYRESPKKSVAYQIKAVQTHVNSVQQTIVTNKTKQITHKCWNDNGVWKPKFF